MNDFLEKGYVFLKSVYTKENCHKLLHEFIQFYQEHHIQSHLNKREDSKTDYFYVNNTFNTLNSFHKQQYYYLPVIDNKGTHDRICDIGMIDFYNIQKLIPNILEYFDIKVMSAILFKLTQKEWKCDRINLQMNNNVQNPQNYHYDSHEENIKFSIYLCDVKEMDEGPLSFIENTTKNKKFLNNQIKFFYGESGDVLISSQHGFHKKCPQKNSISYYLVLNFFKK